MLWAISRVAHLVVEPEFDKTTRRPDALSGNLFLSKPAVVEVRALFDDSFSGKEMMDRTANIISGFADHVRKGAGNHLYFEFMERSYWVRQFHRERCVDSKFELTPPIKTQISNWIKAKDWPNPETIRIAEGKTDVVIRWCETTSPHFRVFCAMPPVAYHLEDNPIYKALKRKVPQIKEVGDDRLRCIFLVDAGCRLLRRLRPFGGVGEIGGDDIIRHALRKLSIDVVCVFSPHRQRQIGHVHQSELSWKVTSFDGREDMPGEEYSVLERLAIQLPAPRFEGYQARDIHRQGGFNPEKRGWYLGTRITTERAGKMTIKISSRLVHEYLAGRMDSDTFQQRAFGNTKNCFELELARGNTIQDIRLERAGIDEDDDYLVLDLDSDWGASPLKKKDSTKE